MSFPNYSFISLPQFQLIYVILALRNTCFSVKKSNFGFWNQIQISPKIYRKQVNIFGHWFCSSVSRTLRKILGVITVVYLSQNFQGQNLQVYLLNLCSPGWSWSNISGSNIFTGPSAMDEKNTIRILSRFAFPMPTRSRIKSNQKATWRQSRARKTTSHQTPQSPLC